MPHAPVQTHKSSMPKSLKKEQEVKKEFDKSNLEADINFIDKRKKHTLKKDEELSLMDRFVGFLKG